MRKKKGGNGGGEPPRRFPPPLIECRSKERIEKLFKKTMEFARAEREHGEKLKEEKGSILSEYSEFDKHERAFFFSLLYDQFAGTYDEHMGKETRHFHAMKELLVFSSKYIRAPLLDITAGTGELLHFALRLAEAGKRNHTHVISPELEISRMLLPNFGFGSVVANEISPKMLDRARRKISEFDVAFTSYNALGLPENWQFKTVLCSQTMHLLAEDDKKAFVQAIHRTLVPGGHAIVLEEDPFHISPTPAIDGVGLFIRAVACPIKHHGTLIAYFENEGFTPLERRAAEPIDKDHVMRLHIFKKSS